MFLLPSHRSSKTASRRLPMLTVHTVQSNIKEKSTFQSLETREAAKNQKCKSENCEEHLEKRSLRLTFKKVKVLIRALK